jgi:hypothetical protein
MFDPDADARILLGVLLDEPTAHVSNGELARLIGWPTFRVEDAASELARSGLVHRDRDWLFPTLSARRYRDLAL